VGEIHIHNSIGESGSVLDYGAAIANTTVHWTDFSGDLVIDNLGQNGTDFLDIRGHGKITFNASCIGGIVNWDGHFTLVNNGSGITFNGDDISTNVEALPGLIAALNDISVSDLLTTQMTEAYAADGAAPTLAQALFMIQQTFGEFSISGTTITVKKLDGSTTAATYTLDDGTTPTSRTRAT
jgi:hypothetical protein